jgi:hypothetical protein
VLLICLTVLNVYYTFVLCRVAGGWVRDKILNQDSNDIDIALDDQSGIEFATGVNEYLSSLGHETRTVAVIQVKVIVWPYMISFVHDFTGIHSICISDCRQIPINQST